MTDLAAGVTRYPVGTAAGRMPRVLWLIGGLCFVVTVVAACVTGGDPRWIAGIVAVGILLPLVSLLLPWWLRIFLLIGVTVAAGLGVDRIGIESSGWDWGRDRDLAYAACYFGSLILGLALLWKVSDRRAWRRRLARAEGAPPSGQDPTGGRKIGRLLIWSDSTYEYEVADPSIETTLHAVRALDGETRTFVSVHIGRGELDIGGDAEGTMIIQQSDNRRSWRKAYQVADPAVIDRKSDPWASGRPKIHITYAGSDKVYPDQLLTTLTAAEAAVRSWLDRGERDRSLNWWRMPGWDGLQRPPALQERDSPGGSSGSGDTDASHGL